MKIKLLLFLWCISANSFFLLANEKDSLSVRKNLYVDESEAEFFHFPELDKKFPVVHKESFVKVTSPEFTFDAIQKEFPAPLSLTNDAKQEAKKGFREIDSTGRWIGSFRNEDIQVLPVGIKHKVNEVEYQLGFTKARFTKDYTELTVFAKVILPQSDKDGLPIELFFGANNVKLSHQGGIIGDANLVLLGDMFIPFNGGNWLLILKGGFDYKTGDALNKTFVTINCDGVKEMGIEGEVQFSRNLILPVKPNGDPLPETVKYEGAVKESFQIPNRVKGQFRAIASDWNDLIVEVNLSPFVLANQSNKFMFSVNQAVFDFSDLRTLNVNFPQHYFDEGLLLPSPETWRGVYVESLEVGLPKEFKTDDSIKNKSRVSFEAANLIIDSYGVSGYFSAKNLIPLESGRTSESKAWAYSVDAISISLVANRLVGADFNGRLLLPVSDIKTGQEQSDRLGLGYAGIISEEEYSLVVSTLDTINFDVFKAKAQLLPNSGVELTVVEDNFRPKAVLNGRMAISTSQKKSLQDEGEKEITFDANGKRRQNTVEFKGIEFQNLVLQTETPIISVDYFGYRDEVKLANFPVSIADIAFTSNAYGAGLEFDLMINLMGKNSKGFAATTRLGVFGKFEEQQYMQKWKYDRLTISKILIDANIGKVGFSGELMLFEDDPTYGKGFTGKLSLDIFDTEGLVQAKGLFGNTDSYRYFYVDFIGILPATIPIVPPVGLNAIGGGLSYNMERIGHSISNTSQDNLASNDIGQSLSGLIYEPNNEIGLDLRAAGFLGIKGSEAFRGKIMFSMLFNKNGGLNRIGFDGFGEFMVSASVGVNISVSFDLKALKKQLGLPEFLNKITPNKVLEVNIVDIKKEFAKSSLKADLHISYDFNNETLHGNSNIYVSVVDGLLRGIGPENRAGWAVFHFAPSEWYVHIGTPEDRLGLKMGIGSFSLETGGYFMIGDRMPGSPPPPPEVAEILGVDANELDYMRDENALGEGKGFAFGVNFKVDTGDLNFLILYARFQAGVGLDIMVKNYGQAKCINTGRQVGINGWYANGQAYAYLQGELGINIKLFFIRKKIPIIKGGAAILMQAKGPNPFWMRGYAAGYYDLLGGLVKGSYRFKITLGEECEFDNASPLGGIKMITDLTPRDNSGDVDVFAAPQAAFAMKVNQPLVIPEDDGDKTYKVILDRFNVTDKTGKEIVGKLEWGRMNDRATFISDDILPPDSKLKVTVEVSFQEKVNGVFKDIYVDGQKAVEKEERNFTTGGAPDHIPLHNIQYSYPVVDQQLFYPGEYNKGYIQLQRGQDYLFDDSQWKSTVKYIDETGGTQETAFGYNNGSNKVNYTLPKVSKDTKYLMAIVSTSKNTSTTNTGRSRVDQKQYDDGNTVQVRQNQAENILKEGEIDRLSYEFKSSEHKTFASKMKNIKITRNNWSKINSLVIYLESQIRYNEGFDLVELLGNKYSENKALVVAESDLKDIYFVRDINPILYQKFNSNNKYSITRDPSEYGYIPKKALPIFSNYITSLENETNLNWRRTRFPYKYNLPFIYYRDYISIRDRVYNDYAKGVLNSNSPEISIIKHEFRMMPEGKYTIKLQYILPGNIKGTSFDYKYKNELSFRQ